MNRSEIEYQKFAETMDLSEKDEIYEFGYKCYLQGINDSFKAVEEITLPEIEKRIEDEQFIEYIKNLLEHPEEMIALPVNNGTIVDVVTECKNSDSCICFPDRCSAIDQNDGMCHQKINIDITKSPEETYIN